LEDAAVITESTIWHGDSRTLTATIDQPVNLIVTDPPYGMNHESNFAETAKGKLLVRKLDGDGTVADALKLFSDVMTPLVARTADDADMYVFCRWNMIDVWTEAVNALTPFDVKNVLVWEKTYLGMGDVDGNWGFAWEAILFAKKGRRHLNYRRNNVLAFPRVNQHEMIHPTQKPVELVEELLKISSSPGDLVVDPFSGSGTTAVAAHRLGRIGLGIETDEFYILRARQRLQQGVFDL
jgi:site-specific DNA-methyltransferase (adenine-specific)